LFGLNHTTNRYYGASLADQLGNSCWRAKPKFFFPPDWVAEKSRGPAEVAVFAVTYCDDPETLGAIARRDKRIGVLKALAGNKHLTRDDYAFMVGRVRDTEHRDAIESTRRRLHLDETAIARVEFEALTPVPSERARFDRTIAAIDGGGNAAGLLGALFEDEARHVKHCAVDMYFKETYIASTNDELWSQSRRSPVEVLRLYTGAAQAEVLTGFVKVLDPSKAPASLLGLDLVEVLVEHGITPPALV
jgi:hypothetical protein